MKYQVLLFKKINVEAENEKDALWKAKYSIDLEEDKYLESFVKKVKKWLLKLFVMPVGKRWKEQQINLIHYLI